MDESRGARRYDKKYLLWQSTVAIKPDPVGTRELANEPKRFVSVDCGYHNLLPICLGENRYRELIVDFMENGIKEERK